MKKSLKDIVKLVLPMGAEKKEWLGLAGKYLGAEDLDLLKHYLRMDRCFAHVQKFGMGQDAQWPLFKTHVEGKELREFLERINASIRERAHDEAFAAFAPKALERITGRIAENIVGMDAEKRAAALTLFATDPIHLLLVGDPGTGKTDILRSLHDISPIASFGLGSGVSGVGLSAAAKGDEIMKGLLPLADGGIACIDELNLIKAKDLAALYNAMEKGFVGYDKGTKHETLPARVRVVATANPGNQTFVGQSAEVLRKQVPFGDALMSRFNLIFVVRKPSDEEFEEIAKKIVKGKHSAIGKADAEFIKEYVRHAQGVEVTISPELELRIVDFVKGLKRDERKFLVEVGPRTVVGTVRLVKAVARAELSTTVTEEHVDAAFDVMRRSLYVRHDGA